MFIPKSREDAIDMTRRKPNNREFFFDEDVKETLCELFNQQIRAEDYLSQIKNKFNNKKIDLNYIFDLLDVNNNGYITMNDVSNK